jgi:hypothetical protein
MGHFMTDGRREERFNQRPLLAIGGQRFIHRSICLVEIGKSFPYLVQLTIPGVLGVLDSGFEMRGTIRIRLLVSLFLKFLSGVPAGIGRRIRRIRVRFL